MTKTHDDNLRASGQLPPTGGMGEEQIAELERLLKAATPGPWRVSTFEVEPGGANRMVMGGDNFAVAYVSGRTEPEHDTVADLIVALVNAAPALLAAAEGEKDKLCDDCPPVGYPTDKTRCLPCPRRIPPSHPDRREQYARIIDQEAFELIKHYSNLDGEEAAFRAYPQLRERRDDALSKADQILALPVPGGWLPIEGAPKDGTPILAAWRTGAAGEGDYTVDKLWWAGQWCPYSRNPTHWQPLPAPPSTEGGA